MVMALNTELRKLIDAFSSGNISFPVFVGSGSFYFVPSKSERGEFYIVCKMQYTDEGKFKRGWACSCKAWRFDQSGEETCKHIREVREGLSGGPDGMNEWKDGTPTSSQPASKSKRVTAKPRAARSSKPRVAQTAKASTGRSSKTKA